MSGMTSGWCSDVQSIEWQVSSVISQTLELKSILFWWKFCYLKKKLVTHEFKAEALRDSMLNKIRLINQKHFGLYCGVKGSDFSFVWKNRKKNEQYLPPAWIKTSTFCCCFVVQHNSAEVLTLQASATSNEQMQTRNAFNPSWSIIRHVYALIEFHCWWSSEGVNSYISVTLSSSIKALQALAYKASSLLGYSTQQKIAWLLHFQF